MPDAAASLISSSRPREFFFLYISTILRRTGKRQRNFREIIRAHYRAGISLGRLGDAGTPNKITIELRKTLKGIIAGELELLPGTLEQL